ncbi:MAG: isoprenylcysteine carboxylmethyltransferase family protein [Anaerolineae bacterium]|nr:isoprenylcysteine carboxylmethyltransferase family protein [Anaerolineae bacterium]
MLRHVAAILALPFMVTIVIPAVLITQTQAVYPGWDALFPLNMLLYILGLLLIGVGLLLVLMTVGLFATVGQGTLAPWDPTQRLVVIGIYRYVRNPMISGVFAILLGEGVMLGSLPVLSWALIFIVINMIYIPLSEEPGLHARFGADYDDYAHNVPRWLPRRSPWTPPATRG